MLVGEVIAKLERDIFLIIHQSILLKRTREKVLVFYECNIHGGDYDADRFKINIKKENFY